jgi:anti-sigma-K factor RskA
MTKTKDASSDQNGAEWDDGDSWHDLNAKPAEDQVAALEAELAATYAKLARTADLLQAERDKVAELETANDNAPLRELLAQWDSSSDEMRLDWAADQVRAALAKELWSVYGQLAQQRDAPAYEEGRATLEEWERR